MYSLIFYHLGYCFRRFNLLEFFKNNLITYFALSTVWAYMIYSGSMELAIRNYGTYGLVIMGAIAGTILVYMLSGYIQRACPRWIGEFLRLAGESTICILIIHTLYNGRFSAWVARYFSVGYIYHMGITILLQVFAGIVIYQCIGGVKGRIIKRR